MQGVFAGQKTQSAKVTASGKIAVVTTTWQVDPNTGWWTTIQTNTEVPFMIDLTWRPSGASSNSSTSSIVRSADGSVTIYRSMGQWTSAVTSGTLLFGGEDFTKTGWLIYAGLNDTKSGTITIVPSK